MPGIPGSLVEVFGSQDRILFKGCECSACVPVLSSAVNRYVRALKRLKDVFQGMPGGIEGIWG
jgi:hypothetical protein